MGQRGFDDFTWDTPRPIETDVRVVELGPYRHCCFRHMKRTSLVLDEELLEEAVRMFGVKTYSATVNLALKEALRMRRIQGLADYVGKVEWHGDLSEMRRDSSQ